MLSICRVQCLQSCTAKLVSAISVLQSLQQYFTLMFAYPRDPSIKQCLFCPSKCLRAAKATLVPLFSTVSSSDASLSQHSAVPCWAQLSLAVQNRGNFYAHEAGVTVNPAAFDGDETVLDETCVLPLQPPQIKVKLS